MLTKVFLASAVALVMVGATVTAAPTEAYACKSGCCKKAKAMFPGDRKERRAPTARNARLLTTLGARRIASIGCSAKRASPPGLI